MTCPICGSENYIEVACGEHCEDCGHYVYYGA